MRKDYNPFLIFWCLLSLFFIISCNVDKGESISTPPKDLDNPKLKKVVFYLENSKSMFGYVNGDNDYIKVISELSSKSDFISDGVAKEYVLINGKSPLSVNP